MPDEQRLAQLPDLRGDAPAGAALEPAPPAPARSTSTTPGTAAAGALQDRRELELRSAAARTATTAMPSRTPLVSAPKLSAALGVDVHLKLETENPTRSFKDRMAASAVAAAQGFGIETILCASTGNLGAAVAARCAAAGLEGVDPRSDRCGRVRWRPPRATARACSRCAARSRTAGASSTSSSTSSRGASSEGNLRPFAVEGVKTIAYEIAEQLGWETPDAVVSPVASGTLFAKLAQGFAELAELGLVTRRAAADVRRPARGVRAGRDGVGRRAAAVARHAAHGRRGRSPSAIRATATSRSAPPACPAARSPPCRRS